ncbi:hypothetical protein AB0942_32255 [Streptomyces nodosus]|uniref:hypothetical protein n=1 Tax=Streptomyces nodosus TaxID=40318 RepID=UPI003452C09D
MSSLPHPAADGTTSAPPSACPAHSSPVRLSSSLLLGEVTDLYEQWREQFGPVVPVQLDGVPAQLVIDHQALLKVCREESVFTPDSRQWTELREGRVPADWPWLPQVAHSPGNARLATGDEHRRLRSVLSSGLAQADAASVRRYVVWAADRLINQFSRTGRADIVADYAKPLPMLVMLRLLGLDHSTGEVLLHSIYRLLEGGADARDASEEINGLLDGLVSDRRDRPARDLMSWLIHGPVDVGSPLTDLEVRNLAWLTVVAGAGGCTGWISNVMEQLLRSDDLRSPLLAGQISIAEIMIGTHRTNPAVQNVLGRFPQRDIAAGELGSSKAGGNRAVIPRGTLMILGLAGANADLGASGEYHFAFGAGAHECPTGAQRLARVITQAAIDRLWTRCRNLRLEDDDDSVQWGGSVILRQLDVLQARFTVAQQAVDPGTSTPTELRSSHAFFPPAMLTRLTSGRAD